MGNEIVVALMVGFMLLGHYIGWHDAKKERDSK